MEHGLRRHYTVRAGWDYAGSFVGDAGNIDDLVCFWNLRAADIRLQFIDPAHMHRYAVVGPGHSAPSRSMIRETEDWFRTRITRKQRVWN